MAPHIHRQAMPPPPNNNNNNNDPSTTTPSATLEKTKAGAAAAPAVPLYHPSVFRYSCRGRLRLDSRVPGAGVCQGMQTQLKAIEHLRLSPKDQALNYFQQKSFLGVDGDHHHHHQRMDEIASTTNDSGAAHALQSAYMSNVLVYPNKKHQEDDDATNKPPEDVTEKWSCVGTTEVDLLVLRPQNTKEEEIAAVSPYCAPGMTTRDVNTPTLGRDRTSTIRLGFFEIVYASSMSENGFDDDEEEDESSMSLPQQQMQQQQASQIKNNDGTQTATTTAATDQKENNKHRTKAPTRKRNDDNPNEKKEKLSMPTKIFNSGSNIWQHMKFNAKLIYQATQDDFPNRTLTASKRIIKEFDTTFDRTLTMMKRVATWDWGGDDNNNGNGSDNDKKR